MAAFVEVIRKRFQSGHSHVDIQFPVNHPRRGSAGQIADATALKAELQALGSLNSKLDFLCELAWKHLASRNVDWERRVFEESFDKPLSDWSLMATMRQLINHARVRYHNESMPNDILAAYLESDLANTLGSGIGTAVNMFFQVCILVSLLNAKSANPISVREICECSSEFCDWLSALNVNQLSVVEQRVKDVVKKTRDNPSEEENPHFRINGSTGKCKIVLSPELQETLKSLKSKPANTSIRSLPGCPARHVMRSNGDSIVKTYLRELSDWTVQMLS